MFICSIQVFKEVQKTIIILEKTSLGLPEFYQNFAQKKSSLNLTSILQKIPVLEDPKPNIQ